MAKGGDSRASYVLTCSGAIGLLLRGITIIAAILVIVCAAVNLVDLNIPIPTPNDQPTENDNLNQFIDRVADTLSNFPDTVVENILTSVSANHDRTKALSIWMVILASVAVLLEFPLIVAQFFNVGSNTIFNVVDVVISLVLAAAFFCGAVPASVYTNVWSDILSDADATLTVVVTPSHYVLNPIISVFNLDRITTSTGATAAFGFISMIAFILLALWVIISQCFNFGKQGEKSKNTGKEQNPSEVEKS